MAISFCLVESIPQLLELWPIPMCVQGTSNFTLLYRNATMYGIRKLLCSNFGMLYQFSMSFEFFCPNQSAARNVTHTKIPSCQPCPRGEGKLSFSSKNISFTNHKYKGLPSSASVLAFWILMKTATVNFDTGFIEIHCVTGQIIPQAFHT